jgi:hypothetical protein
MARTHRHGKLSGKKVVKTPEIFLDKDNDFAAIRLGHGIETKSYEKDGFLFSEDAKGQIIEIQILNLSTLAKSIKKSA